MSRVEKEMQAMRADRKAGLSDAERAVDGAITAIREAIEIDATDTAYAKVTELEGLIASLKAKADAGEIAAKALKAVIAGRIDCGSPLATQDYVLKSAIKKVHDAIRSWRAATGEKAS